MTIDFKDDTPIYIQLADKLEELIIEGTIKPSERAPSQIDLAKLLGINPATAGKALTLLLERGVVEKRRGVGMFVTASAIENIKKRRTQNNLTAIAKKYIAEGKALGIGIDGLIEILKTESAEKSTD